MRRLATLNHRDQILFVDLHESGFAERYPDVDPQKADAILHGRLANGDWLYGLDVTAAAWSLVGKGGRVNFLRWRWLRPVSDRLYLFFARHRYTISWVFTGKRRCASCQLKG